MLSAMLAAVLIALVALLWLPLLSELLSVFRRKHISQPVKDGSGDTPRLLLLVPAHDEHLLITGCVRSLLQMAYPPASRRVVVIADNCTDATARLAREEGAEVLERVDREFPGKPRAIAWALGQIDLKSWDACVIIDADSTVAPSFASGLGAAGAAE